MRIFSSVWVFIKPADSTLPSILYIVSCTASIPTIHLTYYLFEFPSLVNVSTFIVPILKFLLSLIFVEVLENSASRPLRTLSRASKVRLPTCVVIGRRGIFPVVVWIRLCDPFRELKRRILGLLVPALSYSHWTHTRSLEYRCRLDSVCCNPFGLACIPLPANRRRFMWGWTHDRPWYNPTSIGDAVLQSA